MMASPFKGLRFAQLEFDHLKASRWVYVLIAALAVIPLLFATLYLAAFSDPEASLSDVPVAVVNQDAGAIMNGEQVNYGEQIVDGLEAAKDGMGWSYVSASEASKGLQDGTFYMTITIPEGFSAAIASAETNDASRATIEFECNESANPLVTQVGQKILDKVTGAVSSSIEERYFDDIYIGVNESAKVLDGYATDARDLSMTMTNVLFGATVVSSGLTATTSGTQTLVSGMSSLAEGTSQLASGTQTLADAATTLPEGATALASGSSALATGLHAVVAALGDTSNPQSLIGASTALTTGLTILEKGDGGSYSGLAGARSAAAGLVEDTATLGGNLGSALADAGAVAAGLETAAGQIATATGALESAHQDIADAKTVVEDSALPQAEKDEINAKLDEANSSVTEARTAVGDIDLPSVQPVIDDLNAALALLSGDIATEESELVGVLAVSDILLNGDETSGTPGLIAGSAGLSAGLTVFKGDGSESNPGLVALVAVADTMNEGVQALAATSPALVSGIETLATGTGALASGSTALAAGTSSLASGLSELSAVSTTLATTTEQAQASSQTVADNLDDLQDDLAINSVDVSNRARVMAEPIETDTSYYTKVTDYGTGFAPFFIALGLWVGTFLIALVCRPYSRRLVASPASSVTATLAGLLPLAAIAAIQAVLIGLVLQFGLKLEILHPLGFYGLLLLTSLVFAAITQLLCSFSRVMGSIVSLLLLGLQIACCGGTFPVDVASGFFQTLSPILPFTYVIAGMRECISGLNMASAWQCAGVLLLMGALCFCACVLVLRSKKTVRLSSLRPASQS